MTFQEQSRWGTTAIEDLVRHGSYVLAAKGRNGLELIDVSNPAIPVHVKTVALPGRVRSLLVVGDVAYATLKEGGLAAVEIANPAAARGVSHLRFDANTHALARRGNHLLVPTDNGRLHLIDIANPRRPIDVAELFLDFCWNVRTIQVIGDTAFLGGTDEICAVDLSGPSPEVRFQAAVDPLVSLSQAEGNLISFHDTPVGGVVRPLVQLHRPTADGLELVGSLLLSEADAVSARISVLGDTLFLPLGEAGLALVDVSNPAQPLDMGRIPFAGRLTYVDPVNQLYLCKFKGWGAVEVALPTAPVFGPFFDPPRCLTCPVFVNDHFVVLDGHNACLHAFDLDRAGVLTVLGEATVPDTLVRLEAMDDGVLFGDDESPTDAEGPWLIDASDPGKTMVVNDLSLRQSYLPQVSGNLGVYFSFGFEFPDALKILDLSDPLEPEGIGGDSMEIDILEALAFHGTNAHLVISREEEPHSILNFDLSDPTGTNHPSSEMEAPSMSRFNDVNAGPDRLNLTNDDDYFVYDFSGATAANFREWRLHQPQILAMAAAGDVLVTLSRRSMSLFDTSDALKPTLLSQTLIAGTNDTSVIPAVYLMDQVVVIALNGFEIFDIANPKQPKRLAGRAGNILVRSQMRGDRLVGFFEEGEKINFMVVDVANPVEPRVLSVTTTPLEAAPMFDIEGDLLVSLATAKGPGLVYDLRQEEQPVLLRSDADFGGDSIDLLAGEAYVTEGETLKVYGVTVDETVFDSTVPLALSDVRGTVRQGSSLVVYSVDKSAGVDLGRAGAPVVQYVNELPIGDGPLSPFSDPVFIGEGSLLHAYDLSEPAAPIHLVDHDATQSLGLIYDLGSMVVIDRGAVAAVYDLSDPEGITELATIPLDCSLTGAAWRDRQLVITDCGVLRVLEMRWLENLVEDWPARSILDMIHPVDLFPPVP